MPTVPVARRQIGIAPLPAARVSPAAPEGAFQAGPDLQPVQHAVEQWRNHDDQLAVNMATVQAAELKGSIANAALARKGVDALGAINDASADWQKGVAEISDKLQDGRQREAFDSRVAEHWADLHSTIERHATVQKAAADEQSTKALLSLADDDAVRYSGDPAKVAQAIAQKRATVADFGTRQGWTPEAKQAAVADAVSGAHMLVIQHFADTEKDLAASAYLDAHRDELQAKDLIQAERLTEAGSVRAESRRVAGEIVGKATSLTEALAKVADVKDPRIADAVDTRVRRYFADQRANDLQERQEAFQSASAIIEKTGSFDRVPLSLRLKMTPEENGALQRREDQIRHPHEYGDDAKFTQLLNLASLSPASQAEFMKADIVGTPGLSTTQRAHLLTLRRELGGHDAVVLRQHDAADHRLMDLDLKRAKDTISDDDELRIEEQRIRRYYQTRITERHHGSAEPPPTVSASAPVPGATIVGATPGYSAQNPVAGLLSPVAKKKPTPAMLEDVAKKGPGYAKYLRDHGFDVPDVVPAAAEKAKL